MQTITLTSSNRLCVNPYTFLGYEGENKANVLEFKFTDGFMDGLGQLYIKRGDDIGYVTLDKKNETYELPVRTSLLSKIGEVIMQVVITKADGTVIKYDKFTMMVKDAIDTDTPLPEDYPSWTEALSEMLAKTQEAADKANEVSAQLLKDKEDGVFNGKDGVDGKDGKDGIVGKDGISPTVSTMQTLSGAIITITDVDGTHTISLSNGKDGKDGIQEESDPIYNAEKSTLALKTEIPTKLSELENDSGFIDEYVESDPVYNAEKSILALKSELPKKVSDLTNDSGFITKTVNNLTNYYTKSETYSKTEVNNLISNIKSLDVEVVEDLPETGNSGILYLLAQDRQAPDIYDEYLYINNAWERIGSTAVDLTNYYTKEQVNALIPAVPTKVSELENDKGYISGYTETDPTVPTHVKSITEADINSWNNKSDFSGDYTDLTNKPTIPSIDGLATTEQLTQGLATKQNTLVAGNNITIVGNVISATGGGSSGGGGGGSSYTETELLSTPVEYAQGVTVNEDVTLSGNVTSYDIVAIGYTAHDTNSNLFYTNNVYLIPTSDISFNNTDTSSNNKDAIILAIDTSTIRYLTMYFKTANVIRIVSTKPSMASTNQFQIYSIKGIKFGGGGSGSSAEVDAEMDSTSENAVQNKVIKAYVDGLVGNVETALQAINSGSGV